LGVKVEELFSGSAAAKPLRKAGQETRRVARNKRSLAAQELFEKLPPQEQWLVLKQIKLMAQQKR
jgi:uncharacterized protein YbjT (DUF2867 family)